MLSRMHGLSFGFCFCKFFLYVNWNMKTWQGRRVSLLNVVLCVEVLCLNEFRYDGKWFFKLVAVSFYLEFYFIENLYCVICIPSLVLWYAYDKQQVIFLLLLLFTLLFYTLPVRYLYLVWFCVLICSSWNISPKNARNSLTVSCLSPFETYSHRIFNLSENNLREFFY